MVPVARRAGHEGRGHPTTGSGPIFLRGSDWGISKQLNGLD